MSKKVIITGNTYPVREKLKALPGGAKWNKDAVGWEVDAEQKTEAEAIVASAGPKKPKAAGGIRHGYRRPASGTYGPGGRRCPHCGARDCDGAWPNGHCDED